MAPDLLCEGGERSSDITVISSPKTLEFNPFQGLTPVTEWNAMTRRMLLIVVGIGLVTAGLGARQASDRLTPDVLKGLALRSIGPALTTGRIVDVEIDPRNPSIVVRGIGLRRLVENDEPRRHFLACLR